VHRGGTLAAAQRLLGGIVISISSVIEEADEGGSAFEHVIDRLSGIGVPRQIRTQGSNWTTSGGAMRFRFAAILRLRLPERAPTLRLGRLALSMPDRPDLRPDADAL